MKSRAIPYRPAWFFVLGSLLGSYLVARGWAALVGNRTDLPAWFESRTIAVVFYVAAALASMVIIMLPRHLLRRGTSCVLILTLLLSIIVAPRLYTFFEAFERDLMVYMTTARRLLDGYSLYAQAWDHKPPAIHWTYAAAAWLLGPTPSAISFMGISVALITMGGCFVAGFRIGGRIGGASAALIWAIASGDLILQANQPNVEVFINACLVWAVALLPSDIARQKNGEFWTGVSTGSLLLTASLFKPVVLPAVALLLGTQGLYSFRAEQDRLKLAWERALLPGAVILLGWAVVVSGFALRGTSPDFIEALFTYNQAYAGNLLENVAHGFRALLVPAFVPYLPIALASIVLLATHRRILHPLLLPGLIGYLIGAWIAFALPGNFFEHYYQLLVPPVAVMAGGTIGLLRRKQRLAILMWLAVGPLLFVRALQTNLPLETIPIFKYGSHGVESVESERMAPWLNAHLGKDKQLFHWGAEPGVYFWSRHPAETKFSFAIPLVSPAGQMTGLATKYTQELIRQLDASPPALIVANRAWIEQLDHPVNDWIKLHYEPIQGPPEIKSFVFFQSIERSPSGAK